MDLLENFYIGPVGEDELLKTAATQIGIIKARKLETSSLIYRDKSSTVTELLCQLHGEIAKLTGYLAKGSVQEAIEKVAAAECVLDIIGRVLIGTKQ